MPGRSKNKYELNSIGGKKVNAVNNQKLVLPPQKVPSIPFAPLLPGFGFYKRDEQILDLGPGQAGLFHLDALHYHVVFLVE
jgi:hypothetical protein